MHPLQNVKIFDFPTVTDDRGTLTFVEGECQLPFPIRRIFYIYDVGEGKTRGGHAHYDNYEVLVAVHGSFDIEITDSVDTLHIHADNPTKGILIPPGVWLTLKNFEPGTVCLAICSAPYEDQLYLTRDYDQYVEIKLAEAENKNTENKN